MIEYVTTPEPATDAGRAKPTPAEVPSPVRSRKQAIEEERCAILEAHEALAGKNHFQLLGLEPGCSNADLDAAFRTRALRFHPDHALDPSLAELRGKRVDVYARLLEAHEVLRDPEKRSRYKATLDARELRTQLQPPAPPTSRAAASLHVEGPLDPQTILDGIRDAQKLIREEKAWDAIQLLEPLISRAEGHSRFRAQVLLSRAYLKNPRWVKRAEEILYGVVREAPEHAEAYVVLGNIYRSGDLRTRAVAMYNRALALHPGHGEASEALAELDPDNAGSDRDPLLKRLFGKATKGS
jgi:tetratricopeptide (TPR) repeat protein